MKKTTRILITGGTGQIGRSLAGLLASGGHEVIVLSRDPKRHTNLPPGVRAEHWDAHTAKGWGELIDADTAIVNLAGESPLHWRWTAAHKRRVLQSRLDASTAVVEAIRLRPPRVLAQASAAGFYGDRGAEELTETSDSGAGWRADVCRRWEAVTADLPIRRVVLRIGIVLAADGGALPEMRRAANWGVSRFGTGMQWIPWIHNADLAAAIRFLLLRDDAAGAFNLSAPKATQNADFMRALTRCVGRRPLIPLPAWALQIGLGEMAETVLHSQRIIPQRLTEMNFRFQFGDIDTALRDLLGPPA